MFAFEVENYICPNLHIYTLRRKDGHLLANKMENCSLKLSWGVTGFLQVFLPISQVVGREILPTRYKSKHTHRRASLRPQEGPTDQYRPQNHQNDRSYRSLGILTVFVPVGTFHAAAMSGFLTISLLLEILLWYEAYWLMCGPGATQYSPVLLKDQFYDPVDVRYFPGYCK